MAQSNEESLFQAIKKDDVNAFKDLIDNAQCGTYRLGRFPVLSLLYLYKSRKILSVYEEKLIKCTNFKAVLEPVEVSKKFSAKAGKCLRLYLNEIISPLEMLLILDKTKHLKQVFPKTKQSAAVRERLKSIYYIKYSLDVGFDGNDIIIARRPLSYREKKNIATICLCSFLAAAVAVCVPITTISLLPKEGDVTKLSQIDFSSQKEYKLKRDIVIPANYSVEKVNCKIVGGGNKLILGKGATLGELNGKLSDMTIESSGDTVFTLVNETAAIENVTVNVSADVTAKESSAFVSLINYGAIDGVTVNVSGNLSALASSADSSSELVFGGIVGLNSVKYNVFVGQIKNCTVNYSQFELVGEASANASFGGVAGINSAYLLDCTVTGEVIADTFDIAGVCYENSGLLYGNVNEANLSQTSTDTGWNPICCGIAITNNYTVENCKNTGNISAISNAVQQEEQEGNLPTVTAAGITYLNSGTVIKCVNDANITAIGSGEAYVGGIAAHSFTQIASCYSSGEINVTAQNVYAGGILGISEITRNGNFVYCGSVNYCISESKFSIATTDKTILQAGGIAGYVREAGFDNNDSVVYLGGSVTNSYFIGECAANISDFGNIAGACGANIYESNSYYINNIEYHNFEGNYYLENSFCAFGKTVTADGSFASAEDKGAISATIEEIQNSEGYKSIINTLEFILDR